AACFTDFIAEALRALTLIFDLCVPSVLVFFFIIERIESAFTQLHIQNNFGVSTQDDIGTTTRHVGGHGNVAWAASTRDDIAFFFVVLSVEDVVLDPALSQ